MEIRPDELTKFVAWFGPATKFFVIAVPILIALAIFFCYLISVVRRGPVEAFYRVAQVIATAVGKDLPATSLRRTLAIARVSIREAIRLRILIGFVIFAILLLFAGWFLDVQSDDPAHLYLSFVLTTTNYLVIVLALLMSAFSLPTDIKNKTIYTVVTKPVRAGEIVVGRIVGFVTLITVLLGVMCLISYLFVVRGIDHEHAVRTDSITQRESEVEGESSPGWEGMTTSNSHHRHTWTVDAEGKGETDRVMGHKHEVAAKVVEGQIEQVTLGPPRGALMARVPIYGSLQFLDREGNPTAKGISVGKEWEYRSYIEGRSMAAAIWTFDGISEKEFPDGLPLALTLSVFRTWKADIEKGVRGIIIVSSTDPRKPLQCEPIGFESQEFTTQNIWIPRKLRPVGEDGTSGREIDLFDDLMHDGQVQIRIQCDDPAQYFGMAQADLYIQAQDASFAWNFVKSYISIWLQMVLVVCLGVMFSTFLSSPVAMLATLSSVLLGFFGQFVRDLWTGEAYGGGPVESVIRLVRQDNVVKPLELSAGDIAVHVVKIVDNILVTIMHSLSAVLPDFAGLGRGTTYVAYNFNFYGDLLTRQCLTTFLYVVAFAIVGYFFLRTREIAA